MNQLKSWSPCFPQKIKKESVYWKELARRTNWFLLIVEISRQQHKWSDINKGYKLIQNWESIVSVNDNLFGRWSHFIWHFLRTCFEPVGTLWPSCSINFMHQEIRPDLRFTWIFSRVSLVTSALKYIFWSRSVFIRFLLSFDEAPLEFERVVCAFLCTNLDH